MRSRLHRIKKHVRTSHGVVDRTYWVRADAGHPTLNLSSGVEGVVRRKVSDVKHHVQFQPGMFSLATNRGVRLAIDSINKVHRIPTAAPRVPISVHFGMGGAQGLYHVGGVSSRIQIARMSGASQMATAHEYGHYIDHHVFGTGQYGLGALGTHRNNPKLKPLMRVLARSEAVQHLIVRRQRALRENDPRADRATNYLLMRTEIFARAYCQWIAQKSNNEHMRVEVNGMKISWRLQGYRGVQWEHADFQPIAKEFDRLFQREGLLR